MLTASPAIAVYFGVLAALLGACLASFLNCMGWRIVHGESVLRGRSHCDTCGHVLSVSDLFPIFSYLFRRGRCKYCGVHISIRHFLCELTGAIVFPALLFRFDISLQTLEWMCFCAVLMACAFADLEGYIIPDRYLIAGLVLRLVFLPFEKQPLWSLLWAVIGGISVAGILYLIILLLEKIRKKELMGGGDIKLLALTGFWLGWQKNLLCLLLACFIGIIFGLIAMRRNATDTSDEESEPSEDKSGNANVVTEDDPAAEEEEEALDPRAIPWGPSIALSAFLCVLFGDLVLQFYLGLF